MTVQCALIVSKQRKKTSETNQVEYYCRIIQTASQAALLVSLPSLMITKLRTTL